MPWLALTFYIIGTNQLRIFYLKEGHLAQQSIIAFVKSFQGHFWLQRHFISLSSLFVGINCWNNVEMIGRLAGIELMCTFYIQHGLVWDPLFLDLWSGLLWCLSSIYCNYFSINNWIGLAIPLYMRASLCALLHIASLYVLILITIADIFPSILVKS